jgi:hypothetical protein
VSQESQDKESNKKLAEQGVIIKPFDVSAEDASALLKGIDVVIATPASQGVPLQPQLVRAAAAAGVNLFVPAEWGGEDPDSPFHSFKESIRVDAAKLGLPTTSFFSGIWIDRLPMFGWDLKSGKLTIRGEGVAPISFTSTDDVARFAAHTLTHVPRERLENQKLYFEADRIVSDLSRPFHTAWLTTMQSFYTLAQELQKVSPKPLEIVRTGRQEVDDAVAKNPKDMIAQFFLAFEQGKGAHKPELSNGLWPEFNPKSAVQVLSAMLD